MARDPRIPPPATPPVDPEAMSKELTGWEDPIGRLRAALSGNEMQLFCQPILRLSGANDFPMSEILVRLREEEQKLRPPGEFLPAFEHCMMMPELDRWVAIHAIEFLARRPAKTPTLSVNISSQTLEDPDFLPAIAGELVRREINSGSLCFEIDEVDTLARPEASARFAAGARRIGCPIVIDGFGHRSVTFNAFTALQAGFVKVDGTIVRRILDTPRALNKLNAIIRVGGIMKVAVIAECVETQEILDRLRELGVTYAQGFGIALPRPLVAAVAPV